MQSADSKNCPALCLVSSPLIFVVSPHPQGAGGRERHSFLPLQMHVSASKCGAPEAAGTAVLLEGSSPRTLQEVGMMRGGWQTLSLLFKIS